MSVNQAVYGGEDTWVRVPRVRWGDLPLSESMTRSPFTFDNLIDNGTFQIGTPIDTSIAFSGLGTECQLCHLNVFSGNSLAMKQEWNEMPFALAFNNTYSSPPTFELDQYNKYNFPAIIYSPVIKASESYNNRYTKSNGFITRIPYRRLVLVPFIVATDAITGYQNQYNGDLDTYMEKGTDGRYGYEKYPYIRYVKLLMYAQDTDVLPMVRTDITNYFYNFIYNFAEWNVWDGKTFFEVDASNALSYSYGFCHGGYYGGFILYGNVFGTDQGYVAPTTSAYGHLITDNMTYEDGQVYLQYTSEFKDKLMKDIACFGMLFTTSSQKAITLPPNAQGMFMGVLDDNWVGHGDYVEGTEIEELDQYKNGNTDKNEYDPTGGGGGLTDSTDEVKFKGVAYSINTIYKDFDSDATTSISTVTQVIKKFRSLTEEEVEAAQMYGQDPSQRLIRAWRLYAYDKGNRYETALAKLGDFTSNIMVESTNHSRPYEFECGKVKVPRIHNNFLDFEPYTTVRIYVPFCGSMDIPASLCMGRKIELNEIIHPHSGDIIANVYIVDTGRIYYGTLKGNCAEELALNAEQSSSYAIAQHQYKYQAIQGAFKTANSIVGGVAGSSIAASYGNVTGAKAHMINGAIGAAAGAMEVGNNMYLAEHSAPAIDQISTAAPTVQYYNIVRPHVLIASPIELYDLEELNRYKKLRGVPIAKAMKLNECSGFTQCSEIVLDGIDATSTEKEMIREMLRKGVIL